MMCDEAAKYGQALGVKTIQAHNPAFEMRRNAYRIPLVGGELWLPRIFYVASLLLLAAYYPKFGKYATYDWLGLIAVVTTYGSYLLRAKLPKVPRTIYTTFILLIIGAAVTIPNDPVPLRSAFPALLMIYTLIIWTSLPTIIFKLWTHIRMAMAALSLSVMITVLYALGHKYFGFPTFAPVDYWGRAVGLTRQPNELGTFCGMVFPYIIALWVTTRRFQARVLWIVVALLAVLGVLLSGSMTAAFSLVAGTFVYYMLTNRKARRRTVILGCVGVALLMGVNALYSSKYTQSTIQRLERLATTSHGKLTLDQRLVANRHAWEYIESNPLQGKGYHSKVKLLKSEIEVHNTIIRAWYDGGIFTLFAILILFTGVALLLLKSWKRIVNFRMVNEKPYVAAAIGAYAAFLVMMQASPVLYQRSALFAVAIAIAVCSKVLKTTAISCYQIDRA